MGSFFRAAAVKLFRTPRDIADDEKAEVLGQAITSCRYEIDFWKGFVKYALFIGIAIGSVIVSFVEMRVGLSFWLWLCGLR